MRIRSIETYRIRLPFRFSFGHSLSARNFSQNIIVKVTLEDGSVGWGEGVPRDYVTGESIDSAEHNILSCYVPLVIGLDCSDTAAVAAQLRRCFQELELDRKKQGASWCALELAMLDAAARSQNLSWTAVLGQSRQRVRFGGVIPFGGRKALKAVLTFYKLFGFKTVKIKVGSDIEADADKLAEVRRTLGNDVVIRVDANCAWTLEQALKAAERFRPFGVSSYEQPLPAENWEGLQKLTAAIPEDVLVDESLCTLEQARQIAEARVAGAFNIRLSKAGGVQAAADMASIARKHGLRIHMGAQVGESGILSAAGRFFALWQDPFENYEGSNNFFLLRKDLTAENLNVGMGGWADLSFAGNRKGLGITVTEKRLLELTDANGTAQTTNASAANDPCVEHHSVGKRGQ